MERITINVTPRSFYIEFLKVLKSRSPIDKLRPKELKVLSEIMFQYGQLKGLRNKEKYELIFSKGKRKEMRGLIGISEDSFNNNLSTLRRHGLLSKDNMLNKSLELEFNNNFSLEFSFKDSSE